MLFLRRKKEISPFKNREAVNFNFIRKRLLLDLAGKLASFKNKELQNSSLEIQRFQLSEGLFTSLSFQNAVDELQFILKEKNKMSTIAIGEERIQGKEPMAIFMRVDKLISASGLYELLQKIIIAKFGIITMLVVDGDLPGEFKNLLIKHFGAKYDEKIMVR
jgi:hypothetical protein